jgi:hypothetical protein
VLIEVVVGADANGAEVLGVVEPPGVGHDPSEEVVDRTEDEIVDIEDGVEDLLDAAEGGMADEDLGEHQLVQPGLGHGEVKEDLVVLVGRRGERRGHGVPGVGLLAVEELATDAVALGEASDRLSAGADRQRQVGAGTGPQPGRRNPRKEVSTAGLHADERSSHTDSFRETSCHFSHRQESVFLSAHFPPTVTRL